MRLVVGAGLICIALGVFCALAFTVNRRTELRWLSDDLGTKPREGWRVNAWKVDRPALRFAQWLSVAATYGGIALAVAGFVLVCAGWLMD